MMGKAEGDVRRQDAARPSATRDVTDYYASGSLSVRFYDHLCRISGSLRGDIAFYLERLGCAPKYVLELGCGTGRVALALANAGHRVIGIDLSSPMIDRAKGKLKRLSPEQAERLSFRQGDLLHLELPSTFDAVLLPFFVFNHLDGPGERTQALLNIARHLKDDGFAIIHACLRDRLMNPPTPKQPGATIRFADTGARLEVTWHKAELDEARRMSSRLVDYHHISQDGALLASSSERLVYHWFSDAEVEREAAEAGLQVVEQRTSFGDDAGREAIYILRRSDYKHPKRAHRPP